MGRPSKYKEEYCEQAEKLCKLGLTDKQLSVFFAVSEPTLNKWKKDFPEFLKSLKVGKDISDDLVVRSLFERATGYSHPDTHICVIKQKVVITPIIKEYPPDTTACIFWLKNRDKENWRDRPEEGGGENPEPISDEFL